MQYHFTLAEDDTDFLILLRRALLRAFPGSSVSSCVSGNEASKILAQGTDLLIADYNLGAMIGTDLVRTLRRQGATFPIILMSGDPGRREECLDAGANAFFEKTSGFRSVLEEIEKLLPVHA